MKCIQTNGNLKWHMYCLCEVNVENIAMLKKEKVSIDIISKMFFPKFIQSVL